MGSDISYWPTDRFFVKESDTGFLPISFLVLLPHLQAL
jgi:hypothetical protein